MEFLTWLRSWLTRHPLKEPADAARAHYTAEVMARVRAVGPLPGGSPARAPVQPWAWWSRHLRQVMGWPRFAVAMATAAGVAFAVHTAQQTRRQLAQQPQGVTVSDPSASFAESPASDEEWLEQTLQLLEQLEEDSSTETAGDGADEEDWLEELQWLDDSELSTAS